MTAPRQDARDGGHTSGRLSAVDEAAGRFERTCRAAIDGRRAARVLAGWSKRFELSEPDLQVLWALRRAAPESLDQATLANHLATSPAQVSATVERLRRRHWIVRMPSWNDRRRSLWQLTSLGQQVMERILAEAQECRISDCGLRRAGSSATPAGAENRPARQSAIRNPQSEEDAA